MVDGANTDNEFRFDVSAPTKVVFFGCIVEKLHLNIFLFVIKNMQDILKEGVPFTNHKSTFPQVPTKC